MPLLTVLLFSGALSVCCWLVYEFVLKRAKVKTLRLLPPFVVVWLVRLVALAGLPGRLVIGLALAVVAALMTFGLWVWQEAEMSTLDVWVTWSHWRSDAVERAFLSHATRERFLELKSQIPSEKFEELWEQDMSPTGMLAAMEDYVSKSKAPTQKIK